MKFTQLLAALFLAATAHAAAVDLQRGCQDECLDVSNQCARENRRERHCDEEFHRCEERCHRDEGGHHDHHDEGGHDHDHHDHHN